jgi:O-acetyl-ADP-ribose deacetylase (regulator of RNase III)
MSSLARIKINDITNITEGILVQGCNCQGVMGSGVALAIRNKYPEIYTTYKKLWDIRMELKLGSTQFCVGPEFTGQLPEGYEVWRVPGLPPKLVIVNAMTQYSFGKDGHKYVDYHAVGSCFQQVRAVAGHTNLPVYYPLIGCGLGGGEWSEVWSKIDSALHDVEHYLVLNSKTVEAFEASIGPLKDHTVLT